MTSFLSVYSSSIFYDSIILSVYIYEHIKTKSYIWATVWGAVGLSHVVLLKLNRDYHTSLKKYPPDFDFTKKQ